MTSGNTPEPDEVPEELIPLSWLIGKWIGVGLGTYPTIEDFRFGQELVFRTDGRPFLHYSSNSWLIDDDGIRIRPAASEVGYWRPKPERGVEVLLAHSTGHLETYDGKVEITELSDGEITGARCELRTDIVARSVTAKEYDGGVRLYGLIAGDLGWAFDMAAVGQEMTNHISARLAKIT